jgi:hypothetical protein
MGEAVPSDYALWISGTRHPQLPWARVLDGDEAAQVWNRRLERAWSAEELCVINWHPFHSLQTAERVDALKQVMDHARRLPGLATMTMSQAGRWWEARLQVRMEVLSSDSESLRLKLYNWGHRELAGVTVRVRVPEGKRLAQLTVWPRVEAREVDLAPSPTNQGWLGIRLALPHGEPVEVSTLFAACDETPDQ